MKIFNIKLEFNHTFFFKKIANCLNENKAGYVCVVDANVLAESYANNKYQFVLNNSLVNTCDGSSIALLASKIYAQDFRALNGPEIFEKLIVEGKKQVLLGGNPESAKLILERLKQDGKDISDVSVLPLPFLEVDQFDYPKIAKNLNRLKPDYIWVSLGAPKQEFFMYNLLPYLERGVMFGIGAAFNFYIGQIKIPSFTIGGLKFLWLSRIISEPVKQFKRLVRYLFIVPKIYFNERRKVED